MIQNVDLVDALGRPATIADADGEPTPLDLHTAVQTVIWNMPTRDLSIGDSELARDALRGMAAANGGAWEVTDQLQRWTFEKLRAHAPRVFGIHAICIVEAFEASVKG